MNPFGAESLEHLENQLISLLEPSAWVERFRAVRSDPKNNNIREVDDANIDMFRYNLKTLVPEWKRYSVDQALNDIVKSDMLGIYNEVMEQLENGNSVIKNYPMIYTLLNCAYAVQRHTFEELTDRNEQGHLDVSSLLTAIRHIQKLHKNSV